MLATKVWGQMSDDPDDRGLSAGQIAKQIDASLERRADQGAHAGAAGRGGHHPTADGPVYGVKVAVTCRAALMVTVQLLPEQPGSLQLTL